MRFVHAEVELVHVAHDQTGQKDTEVAAAACRILDVVESRDDGDDRDGRGLAPDPGSAARDDEREDDADGDPDRGRDRELHDEVDDRLRDALVAVEGDAGECQREHGADRVVERRLGDDRLRDLGTDAEALEERDQDRRIGRRQDGSDEEADLGRDAERRLGDEADDHGREDHAGHHEQPQPDRNATQDVDGQVEASVEENDRDAERENELRGDRIERDVDPAGHRGTEHRSREQQDDHPRQA